MQQISDNIINHYGFVVDESSSMSNQAGNLVKALDGEIAWLATRSREVQQETRVSVWAFNSRRTPRCILWDVDALRVPSIAGHYHPAGLTALRDCFSLAIDDFGLVTEKYGRHGFFLFGLTDGDENDSLMTEHQLAMKIGGLPGNYSTAILVPNDRGMELARRNGFPADNVSKWDATSAAGIAAGASVIREVSETYFQARAAGHSRVTGLFRVNALSDTDLRGLYPLTVGSYKVARLPEDMAVNLFTAGQMGHYQVGKTFYRLTKPEDVQDYKEVAVRASSGDVYMDKSLRVKLGLPPLAPPGTTSKSRVKPSIGGLDVFIQSTSHNRKLIGGTEVLMLR